MGTVSKITGTLATAISKVSGVAISGLSNIIGQTISLFSYSDSAYVLDFDGTDDYVDCGNDSSMRNTTARTIACWVRRDNWNDNIGNPGQSLLGNFRYSNGMHLRWKSKRIQGFAYIEGTQRIVQTGYAKFHNSSKPYWRSSGWSMVALAFDGQYLKLYVNGALDNSSGTPTIDLGSTGNELDEGSSIYFNIGRQPETPVGGAGAAYFDGQLDECAVWNTALDADDIAQLWNDPGDTNTIKPQNLREDKGNYDKSSNLKGWWRFEEGSGTSVADSSGTGNTGTVTNSPTYSTDTPD